MFLFHFPDETSPRKKSRDNIMPNERERQGKGCWRCLTLTEEETDAARVRDCLEKAEGGRERIIYLQIGVKFLK